MPQHLKSDVISEETFDTKLITSTQVSQVSALSGHAASGTSART